MRFFILILLFSISVHGGSKAFHIQTDSIPELAEILISAPKKKMYVREDTSFFRVNAFADGTEKTIADLLKKIPGFSVDAETGIITYQGRTVEKLNIDGADLFGSNYVIGSKNLSASWIEEIQAIENDPDNPLLKKMTSNGKLVINLKTKKKMARINTQLNTGSGYRGDEQMAADNKLQALGMSSRFKSFAVAGYNNRGINNGATDYLQYNERKEPFHYGAYKISPLLKEPLFFPLIEPDRSWINNNALVNTNIIYQPGARRQSIRMNAYYSRDQLYTQAVQTNLYSSAVQSLFTSDRTSSNRKRSQFQGELEWKQFLTNDIWLNHRSMMVSGNQTVDHEQIINDSIRLSGKMNASNLFHWHESDLTFRISPQTIFRTTCTISSYRSNEQMRLLSDRKNLSGESDYIQDVYTQKNVFRYEAALMIKRGSKTLEFAAGVRHTYDLFQSTYNSVNDTAFDFNGFNGYKQKTRCTRAHQATSITYRKGKSIIHSGFQLFFHDIQIRDQQENNRHESYIRPDLFLSVTQNVSDEMKWIHHLNIRHQLMSDMPYFDRPIRVSARVMMLNDVIPEIRQSLSYQSIFMYHDLFRQQSGQFDFLYVWNNGSSAPYLEINDKITLNRLLILRLPQKVWHVNGRCEKFIASLYTTFSLEGNLSFSMYYNHVNVKQVRENRSMNRKVALQMKTALPFFLNFSYRCSLENGMIQTGDEKFPGNFWWQQSFNIIWKYKKEWHGQIKSDWYQPQQQSAYSVLFLDALMSYRPAKKNYGFCLSARNILNHHFFQQTRIIDYSTLTDRVSLLPLTILLEWDYRF